MMLQGGVSQNNYGGGVGNGIGGATPWGMIAQAVEKQRDNVKQGFTDLANIMGNNALSASMSNVTFNPTMAQMPSMGYMQPSGGSSMGNLFNYLAR